MSHDNTNAKLIYMANQIATFFKSQPDDAAQGVAAHINRYWEPRMRIRFFELLAEKDNGFDALVVEAAPMVRRPVAPADDAPGAASRI